MAATRRRTVVLASGAVLLVLGVLATMLVVGVTQTAYGRQLVRDLVHEQLAERVQGRLHVGRITGGLFTGVTVDSLEIRGVDDSLFVASGPITLEYDPRDLLDRRLLLRHARVERPVVHLRRYAGGEWNFRRIFPSGVPRTRAGERRGFGDFVVLDSATVVDGRLLLTLPWHPADSLRGARRDSAVAANVARDDAEIRPTLDPRSGPDTTYARTWRWTGIRWASSGVRLADPDSVGRHFGIAHLDVDESDPPFRFRNVRGDARLLGDTLWFELAHFDLPASTGRAAGKAVWGSGLPVRYDLRFTGDSVSLADVAWVYPTLPRTGGGRLALEIRNAPDDVRRLDYALRDMDVRTTRSRLRGDMTFSVGGPVLVVKDVALRADPVDFDLLRALAGGPFPYDWQGTLTGTVRAPGGPLNRFRVDSAAVVFRDANVPGAESRGSARGELDVLDPAFTRFRGLRVAVAQLDLRTLQYVNPAFPRLAGLVAGTATLDSVWTDVRFRDADLVHTDGALPASRATGAGRVTLEDAFIRYDVDLVAQPVSFTTLARSYPALPLRGEYAGPLRVRGTLDDLAIATTLAGPAGGFMVDGRFDLFAPRFAAAGTASTEALDLSVLLDRLDVPPTSLTLRTGYDLAGEAVATLAGTFTLDLARSRVDEVRLDPSTVRLAFGGGVATIDSLRVESSAARLVATGGLGLVASQPDSVRFALTLDSLGALRRYLQDAPDPDAPPDTLTGRVVVRGVLSGSAEGIGLAGDLTGEGLAVGAVRAARLDGTYAIADLLGRPQGPLRLALDSARVAGVPLARAALDLDVLGLDAARLRLDVAAEAGPAALATADVRRLPDSATVVVLDTARVTLGDETWRLLRPATLRGDRRGLALDTVELRGPGRGRVLVAGVVPVADSIALVVRGEQVPIVDLGRVATSGEVGGDASFALDVGGVRAAPTLAFRGELAGARFGDVQLSRLSLEGGYAEQRLRAALALARGDAVLLRADATVPVDLALLPRRRRLLDAPLAGNIRSERVDLAVLEGFTSAVREASGSFTLNLDVGGTVDRPTLFGALGIADGAMLLPGAGIRLRALAADVAFAGDSVVVRSVSAASGRSRASALALTGVVGLADRADPRFDLRLTARDFHLVALPRVADLEVSTAPDLHLAGRLTAADLAGGVRVERGAIFLPEFGQDKNVVNIDDPDFASLGDTTAGRGLLPGAPSALLGNLTLRNVGIEMGDEVWLRGPEANINLGGRLNLTTARDVRARDGDARFALDGILTANRGTYRLNLGVVQRTFIIERGSLRFFGEPELNPTLDIVAVHTVRPSDRGVARQDVEVRATIGGTLERPQLRLGGGLAGGENGIRLSESDAVSYLVTGAPSFAIGADQSSEVTAARLALSSLGSYLGDRAAGGLFDVVQFQTSGLQAGDTRDLRAAGRGILAGTRLDLGKQLSDRVFVTANAGLCQLGNVVGGSAFNAQDFAESIGVKVDYRLGGGLSLSAGIEPPTNQLFCSRQISARGFAPTPRQWAFDLFRTWRF